jgi:hypothetical protein
MLCGRSQLDLGFDRDIVTAIRVSNGVTDLEINARLRTAINAARAVDMPKDKIEGSHLPARDFFSLSMGYWPAAGLMLCSRQRLFALGRERESSLNPSCLSVLRLVG